MEYNIPKTPLFILNTLEKNGYEAFLVGGCVRDFSLGLTPKDFDFCTNALPQQIKKCFLGHNTLDVGIKHGTITVIIDKHAYEITTYRTEGSYSDNRRPDNVNFVSDIKEDLSRRDFTINAMAYNPKTGIVDCFGGLKDINKKLIRTVGNANKRFNEDSLRIMRALRFSSTYGFEIEYETSQAMQKLSRLLTNVSAERINTEFSKLLCGEFIEKILMDYFNILSVIIPEIQPMYKFNQNTPYHKYDVWEHTVKAVAFTPSDLHLRLSLFFHDIGKPHCYTEDDKGVGHFYGHAKISADITINILKRLKYDNETVKKVFNLVYYHNSTVAPTEKSVKKWLNKLDYGLFIDLMSVKNSDTLAKSAYKTQDRIELIQKLNNIAYEVLNSGQCFNLKLLNINGNDLIRLGAKPSEVIGKILNKMLTMVINDEIPNDRNVLLNKAEKLIKAYK